jgi:zinc-ribbon domain
MIASANILAGAAREQTTGSDLAAVAAGVAVVVIFGSLVVINVLKAKYWTAVFTLFGVLGLICGVVGAIRIAKPRSWWARHRYDEVALKEARGRFGDEERVVEREEPSSPVTDERQCPQCGREAREGAAYCVHCGAVLA